MIAPVRLDVLVGSLPDLDDEATVCARRPWTGASAAVLVNLDGGPVPDHVREAGYAYFLEVAVAREILEDLPGRPLSADERLRLLVFYAENDAFPDWVNDRSRAP